MVFPLIIKFLDHKAPAIYNSGMLYSRLLGKSLREIPQDIKAKSHALLLQGGYIRPLAQGLFFFLPLGLKVIDNIKRIIRQEMSVLGGQEVQVPFINPYDIWVRGGRAALADKELVRFKDRSGKTLVLSATHEEAMTELVKSCAVSYRDLPVLLYEFQVRYRDEEKTKCGLIRTKEFLMNDAYSFHRSSSELNNFFPKMFAAFQKVLKRCRVTFITAESGVGYMGGEKSYEFLMPADFGDAVIIRCENCGYSANSDVAVGVKDSISGNPLPIERIETPGCTTMEKLGTFLNVPKSALAKSMVFKTTIGYIMAVVRGDYEVSVEKLSRLVREPVLRKADSEELEILGLIPGYLSPLLENPGKLRVVIDDTVANHANLICGANEDGFHYRNVNFGRDFETELVGDIAQIMADNQCIQCGRPLKELQAMELANIFKLGDFYPRALNLTIRNDNDTLIFPHMGSYGIGLGRLLSAIVECNHDDRGIVWPPHLAPFKAYLMGIGKSIAMRKEVERIHEEYQDEILFDDRPESPGVKFKDADLIGIPLRIVVSPRYLQEKKVEFHDRRTGRTWLVDVPDVQKVLRAWKE